VAHLGVRAGDGRAGASVYELYMARGRNEFSGSPSRRHLRGMTYIRRARSSGPG